MRIPFLILLCMLIAVVSFGQGPQKRTEEPLIRLLTYGLPDFEKAPYEQDVARKWGFEFYTVGDCLVDESLIDSVKRVNNAADKRMVAKYGNNWHSRFTTEVDALYATPERAQDLVDQQLYIWRKEKELRNSNDSLRFTWTNTTQKGVYNVMVSGSAKSTIFYKLLVDYPKYKVSLLTY